MGAVVGGGGGWVYSCCRCELEFCAKKEIGCFSGIAPAQRWVEALGVNTVQHVDNVGLFFLDVRDNPVQKISNGPISLRS